MPRTLRHILAFLFVAGTGAWWGLAYWAYRHYGCTGTLKYYRPCFVGTRDVMPLLNFGLVECSLLCQTGVTLYGLLLLFEATARRDAARARPRA